MSILISGKVTQADLFEQDPIEPDGTKELFGYIRMMTERGEIWFRTPKIIRDGEDYKFPKRGNGFLKVLPVAGGMDMLALIFFALVFGAALTMIPRAWQWGKASL